MQFVLHLKYLMKSYLQHGFYQMQNIASPQYSIKDKTYHWLYGLQLLNLFHVVALIVHTVYSCLLILYTKHSSRDYLILLQCSMTQKLIKLPLETSLCICKVYLIICYYFLTLMKCKIRSLWVMSIDMLFMANNNNNNESIINIS